MWQQYVNALLGLCVLVAAFLDLSGTTLMWTLGLLGAAIVILGVWGAGVSSEASTTLRHA